MLAKRTAVVLVLLPVGLALVAIGGLAYTAAITFFLVMAAWEYARLFQAGGIQAARWLLTGGVAAICLARWADGVETPAWLFSLLVLAAMTFHLLAFEGGRQQAGTDFAVTVGGLAYFGWVGSYLVALRELPDGLWWLLQTLFTVWLADSGAYLIGSRWGRRQFSPRLSPRKTWEGYLAGVAAAALGGAGFVFLWRALAGPALAMQPWQGAAIGLLVGAGTVLGDLGESMVKRQVGAKDSGSLLPGHGGAWDRIDSWIWAGVLGYALITLVFL
jgi:phosphatidate cytidylyltransferase